MYCLGVVKMSKFKGATIVEVIVIDKDNHFPFFKGKADVNNLNQMKMLGDTLKAKGVVFPD